MPYTDRLAYPPHSGAVPDHRASPVPGSEFARARGSCDWETRRRTVHIASTRERKSRPRKRWRGCL